MRSKQFLQVIFHLLFFYSLVNSSYIGYPTDEEIFDNNRERAWVNSVGKLNSGLSYLHLFDSFDAKLLVTLDSPTYNFSSYFDNEWAMGDQEVIRYGTNGISFKSKGVMRPVYYSKTNNIEKHAISITGYEQEIRLWGYFSSVCLPDMVAVCLDGKTNLFYVNSLLRNYQYNCNEPNTRFGDQELPDYTSVHCTFNPGTDKWAGFTYFRTYEKFAGLDVDVLSVTEYQESPIVIKKLNNFSPTPVSYFFENTMAENFQRIEKTTWNHAWDVKVTTETEVGTKFVGTWSTKVEVGYTGSYNKEVETQSSVTTTSTESLSVTLSPNTSLAIKQTASFEKQMFRAQICYPMRSARKPWFGCGKMAVGHGTTKEVWTQPTATPHIVSGQLCILGEFNLETNTYSSLILDK